MKQQNRVSQFAKNCLKMTALLVWGMAWGYDGVIYINGEILGDGTCRVELNSQNQTITLPTVSVNTLYKEGKTSGQVKFEIKLSECNEDDKKRVNLNFKNTNSANSILVNQEKNNPAKYVGIQIINLKTNQPLLLNGTIQDAKNESNALENIQPKFEYIAQYYAIGKAEPGNVSATAEFEIVYP